MKEVVDPFGIDVKTLTEIIDKQIRFSFTSGYLNLLKRHGFEREDIIQSILEQLIHDKDDYDSDKAEITTFIAQLTKRKLHRMTRDAMSTKRKAQHLSVAVSINADTPQELINVFGATEDHAGELKVHHIEEILSSAFSKSTIQIYITYISEDISIEECAYRFNSTYKVLQTKFSRMSKYIKAYLEGDVSNERIETEKRNEIIEQLVSRGFKASEVAEFLNIKPATVRKVCEKNGWKIRRAKSVDSLGREHRAREIARYAEQDYNVAQIASFMNIHEMTVRNIAKDFSIQIKRNKKKGG